eukprot:6202385-Pleurochrysis_carterae.AAC.1
MRATTCPSSRSKARMLTQHTCTSSLKAALRRFKRSETTQTQSKKKEAAWRRYWVPLTELLGVARWRKNPTVPDAIMREARLLCKVLLLVLATMRPRRKQDAAPKPASGYN